MRNMREDDDKHPLRMLVLITQIGLNMMVPMFFCAWIGYLVSEKTGIDILFVLFLILGIMAGFRSCYAVIKRFVSLKSRSPEYNISVRSVHNSYRNEQLSKKIPGQEKPENENIEEEIPEESDHYEDEKMA